MNITSAFKKTTSLFISLCLLLTFTQVTTHKAAATTTSDYCVESAENQFLTLINNYRAQNGLSTLTQSWTLAAAAQHHTLDMSLPQWSYTTYGHNLTDGTTWLQNIINHGYAYGYPRSENIAWGYNSPQDVFDAWKASTSHDNNMRYPGFNTIGIDRLYAPGSTWGYYWVTTFGGTADAEPPICPTPTTTLVTPTPTIAPTPSDTLPPSVNITSPLNGATVPVQSSVTITADATDNIGVQKVEFFINNKRKCSDSIAPYTCLWSVGRKANASYSLRATAYDTSGRTSQSTTVSVTSR